MLIILNCSELLELREDEKMALESIYGPAFTEKIPNKGEKYCFESSIIISIGIFTL